MKWQYLVTNEEHSLGRLGEEGWELVSAAPQKGRVTFYFKKPMPSFKEIVTEKQRKEVYSKSGLEEKA